MGEYDERIKEIAEVIKYKYLWINKNTSYIKIKIIYILNKNI